MEIMLENNVKTKQVIVYEVLKDLPEWFGLDDALNEYVKNSSKYLLWVAKENDEILGFISLKETALKVAEIYCMGVKKSGINKELEQDCSLRLKNMLN